MPLHMFDRYIESEGGAMPLTRAVSPEHTPHDFGGQGATVQAKAMPFFSRGEALAEDACDMLGFDTHAGIVHLQTYPALSAFDRTNAEGESMLSSRPGLHGVDGIANQVDQNLQHLVPIHQHLGQFGVLPNHLNLLPFQRRQVDSQGLLHEIGQRHGLLQTTKASQALLHADDLLDVLDISTERREFLEYGRLFMSEILGQLGKVTGNLLPFRIMREIVTQRRGALLQHRSNAPQITHRGFTNSAGNEIGRNIDAVQNIAHIMEHTRGHIGHAGTTRSLHELLLQGLPLVLSPLALRDVAGDNQDTRDFTPLITDQSTGEAQGHAGPSLGLHFNVYVREYTTGSTCQELPGGCRDS